ncbi:MAG TPA: hypothetical protein VMM37_05755 [Bacteroidota bacterium]|nr:hypothetical protein [Bacteroidota bacterium]
MKNTEDHNLVTLLGEYLDGTLPETERQRVEQLLSTDEHVRRELEQLRRMKQLLAQTPGIEPNIGFWTRLSTHLEQSADEENLLPFARRYIPLATISGALGILLIGTVIFQNRMSLFHFVSEKSKVVQTAYEEGLLKGSILPLFAHVNDNQALQFSLLGVLPLDARAETALRVDQDPEKGYQIKFGKAPKKKSTPLTVNDFCAEIDASQVQRKAIDSLIGLARKRIESSVLLSENNAVAIDPALAQLNKEMVSNIAACLEPRQRIRFGRFLEKKDAPYTFISKKFVPVNPETLFAEMSRVPRPEKFVVFTPDSVAIAHVNPEFMVRAQRRSEIVRRTRQAQERNFDVTVNLLKQYAGWDRHTETARALPPPGIQVWGDANAVNIQIQQGFDVPRAASRTMVVVPMPRQWRGYAVTSPAPTVEFGFAGDSVTRMEFLMDSAMVRFFNRRDPSEYNLRMIDSIFTTMDSHFRMHPGAFAFDSVFRSLEESQQRMFDQQRKMRQQIMKEREVRARTIEKSRDDE